MSKNGQKGRSQTSQAWVCGRCGLQTRAGPQCRGCHSLAPKSVLDAIRRAEQSGDTLASTRGPKGGPSNQKGFRRGQGVSPASTEAHQSGSSASTGAHLAGGKGPGTASHDRNPQYGYGEWIFVGPKGRKKGGKHANPTSQNPNQSQGQNRKPGKGLGSAPRQRKGKGKGQSSSQPLPQGVPQPQFQGRPNPVPPENAKMLQLEQLVANLRDLVRLSPASESTSDALKQALGKHEDELAKLKASLVPPPPELTATELNRKLGYKIRDVDYKLVRLERQRTTLQSKAESLRKELATTEEALDSNTAKTTEFTARRAELARQQATQSHGAGVFESPTSACPFTDELRFLDKMFSYSQSLRASGDFYKHFDDAIASKRIELASALQAERASKVKTEGPQTPPRRPTAAPMCIHIHGADSDVMEEDGDYPFGSDTDTGRESNPSKRARKARFSSAAPRDEQLLG